MIVNITKNERDDTSYFHCRMKKKRKNYKAAFGLLKYLLRKKKGY